jgi:hypothetical protein
LYFNHYSSESELSRLLKLKIWGRKDPIVILPRQNAHFKYNISFFQIFISFISNVKVAFFVPIRYVYMHKTSAKYFDEIKTRNSYSGKDKNVIFIEQDGVCSTCSTDLVQN